MSSSEERERARHRLRELAETATPAPADSSGYVDLSAYSSTDPDWVEHALARSRAGEVTSPPPSQGFRALGSVAPLEISKLAESFIPPPPRTRGRNVGIASGVVAGAIAAIVLVVHPFGGTRPVPSAGEPAKQAAAVAPPVVAAPPAPSPAPAAPAPSAASVASAAPVASAPVAAASVAGTPASRPRAPAVTPARSRTPSRPASPAISKSKPAGGGDALTNAILQSLAEPSSKK